MADPIRKAAGLDIDLGRLADPAWEATRLELIERLLRFMVVAVAVQEDDPEKAGECIESRRQTWEVVKRLRGPASGEVVGFMAGNQCDGALLQGREF